MAESWLLKISGGAAAKPASAGDPVERAYRRHWDELCRYVRRSFGAGPPDPEDVAQAAFARFAAADRSLIDNERAYLFRTAHNIAIDARRRDHTAEAGLTVLTLEAEARHDPGPENVIVAREELARLDAALDSLKPKHRKALLMHRLDGLSFAEIARRMDISPSGARKLVEEGYAACMKAMKRDMRR